jgi:hypothetical protein
MPTTTTTTTTITDIVIKGQGIEMKGGGGNLDGKQLTVFAADTAKLKRGLVYDVSFKQDGKPVNFPNSIYEGPGGGPAIAVFQLG